MILQLRTKVFVSYSHKDKEILKRLQVHLEPLVRDGIDIWDDTKIKAGSNWLEEIKDALANAKVAICLISADFLASKFITENELPPLLEAAHKDGVLILPVIVSASRFEQTDTLKWMQSVNPVNQPLRELSRSKREKVYVEIAKIIEENFSETSKTDATNNTSIGRKGYTHQSELDIAENEVIAALERLQVVLNDEIRISPAKKELESILKKTRETREKIVESTFTIAVLALTKSGKSTFLNALLGAEYLPISNVPETASIVHILHSPNEDQGKLIHKSKKKKEQVIRGITKINKYLHDLNKSRRTSNESFNDFITLHAPLYGLGNKNLGKYRFRIIDTAGYNEYGVDTLKLETYDVLENADVIIYLLDYTKLKTDEEGKFFREIDERRRSLVEGFFNRLFFVVNKIDAEDRNGLSKQDVAKYVAIQLRTQINGLDVEPEDILLVSAEHAMLSRIFLEGNSTKAQQNDLAPKLFGYGAASPEKWSRGEKQEWLQKSERLLLNSGITVLEDRIINFLENNSRKLLILAILEQTITILKRTSNYLKITQQQLKSDKAQSTSQIREIRSGISDTLEQFKSIQKNITDMPKRIDKITKSNFQTFQKKSDEIATKVTNQFEKKEITRTSTNKSEISSIVKEIDTQVWNELEPEAMKLEKDLQEILFIEQSHLIKTFNILAQPTLRKIEQVVGKALKIENLHPVSLEIEMPSRENYLLNLSKEVDDLIVKKRGKLLSKPKFTWKFYVIPWIQFFEEEFSISPNAYKVKFNERINKMIAEWSENVRKIINYQINPAFQIVFKAVEEYGNTYESIANKNIQYQIDHQINATKRLDTISFLFTEQETALNSLIELEKFLSK